MDAQTDFDKIVLLLERHRTAYSFSDNLLDSCKNSTVYFRAFHDNAGVMTKEHVLSLYTLRAKIQEEMKPEFPLQGYNELLTNLHSAQHSHILLSVVGTESNTAILFTDIKMQDLIGILYSHKIWDKQHQSNGRIFKKGKVMERE